MWYFGHIANHMKAWKHLKSHENMSCPNLGYRVPAPISNLPMINLLRLTFFPCLRNIPRKMNFEKFLRCEEKDVVLRNLKSSLRYSHGWWTQRLPNKVLWRLGSERRLKYTLLSVNRPLLLIFFPFLGPPFYQQLNKKYQSAWPSFCS